MKLHEIYGLGALFMLGFQIGYMGARGEQIIGIDNALTLGIGVLGWPVTLGLLLSNIVGNYAPLQVP